MANRLRRSRGPSEVYSVTTVRASAAEDRHRREVRYLVAMAFRMICFGGALLITGWVRWAAVAVAVLMPWIAVVLANNRGTPTFERDDPGAPRGLDAGPSAGSASPSAPPPSEPSTPGPVTGIVHLPGPRYSEAGLRSGDQGQNNV